MQSQVEKPREIMEMERGERGKIKQSRDGEGEREKIVSSPSPVVLLIMGAVFLALVLTSRIVSLGSIAAAAVYPVLVPAACPEMAP